jgi:tight adherence protein C
MIYFIAIMMASAAALFFWGARGVKKDIPVDNRKFKDPLPGSLRVIWPLVLFFSFYLTRFVSVERLEKNSIVLTRAGVDYLMSPEQLFGTKCTSALLFGGLSSYGVSQIMDFSFLYLIFSMMLFFFGFFLPNLSLRDMRLKRERDILKLLPVYLDFFTMAVQAGMNLSGAITQAVDKGPAGVLNRELRRVIRDIKSGMSRLEALRTMGDRLAIKELMNFISAVAQSEKTGASIGDTLKIQADQRRVERFQRAEKLAMEAPVKLILPLVAFIFPMTFLIIGFPIVMKFIYEV